MLIRETKVTTFRKCDGSEEVIWRVPEDKSIYSREPEDPGAYIKHLNIDYPGDRNLFGYTLVKLMEAAGDTIKDIGLFLKEFSFDFSEMELGGFGSVHL